MSRSNSPALFTATGRLCQECFTASALRALRAALDAAVRTCWPNIRSPHLFVGLLEEADEAVARWLEQNQLQASVLRQLFLELFDQSQQLPEPRLSLQQTSFSQHLLKILEQARQRALARGGLPITNADLLASVLSSSPSVVAECLRREGYDASRLVQSAQRM
ncbi:MAG: hypothetical protein RMJ19_00015 [Gemmatales bacterium]|nr:hypothetical protein [Gemmatales bacterium]MCS7158830.1 hypothetical protein [Gemmatales bacterium]MDW8174029.1 hypothetical protein [Gemmatales bacterium]MDW8223156.1 hypothetical protein [Gemmatales bacterium]